MRHALWFPCAVAAALFGMCAVACGSASYDDGARPANAVEANATVIDVTDGDTITADIEGRAETIRLIGIDTPETVDPRKPVQCFGKEASARTADLLPAGTPVRIERDVEARDRYGRLLAYVYRASDGLFVNMELANGGYALPLSIPPNVAYAAEFAAAARVARTNGTGLWSACPG